MTPDSDACFNAVIALLVAETSPDDPALKSEAIAMLLDMRSLDQAGAALVATSMFAETITDLAPLIGKSASDLVADMAVAYRQATS